MCQYSLYNVYIANALAKIPHSIRIIYIPSHIPIDDVPTFSISLYVSLLAPGRGMASSSRSRSRSNKRSPDRDGATKEKEETEPEVPSPKGEETAPEGEESAPKGKESTPAGGGAAATGEGAMPTGGGNTEPRASQSKARTTGAVQNRRKKGDPGTWTCDECHRTIADNPCSKKQHWDSLYCRAARLYNTGYADGDWEACKKKVERTWYEEEWADAGDLRLRSNERLRGSDPPPEPLKPPRNEPGSARSNGRSPGRHERKRSHGRARSSGRQRRTKSADGRGRRNRSRSRDRRAREGERRKSHKDDQEADHEEYVKVVVEKYGPRQTTQRQEAIPKGPQKPPPPRPVGTGFFRTEGQAAAAATRQDDVCRRGDACELIGLYL